MYNCNLVDRATLLTDLFDVKLTAENYLVITNKHSYAIT